MLHLNLCPVLYCCLQAKTKELKSSFNEQFSAVHELCLMVRLLCCAALCCAVLCCGCCPPCARAVPHGVMCCAAVRCCASRCWRCTLPSAACLTHCNLCWPVPQVLNASSKPDLIRATLSTLHAFLSWVPLGYIFESNVTEV